MSMRPVDKYEQFKHQFGLLTDSEQKFLAVLSSMVDPTNDELEFKIDPQDQRLAEVIKGGDPIVQLRDCARGLLGKTLRIEDDKSSEHIAWIVVYFIDHEKKGFLVAICRQIRPYLLYLKQLNPV